MKDSEENTIAGNVLVVGCLGMLGRDLVARLKGEGFEVTGLDIPDIDITRLKELNACLDRLGSDLVINCAAYTAVDKAESEPEIAFLVNRDGSANLAEACLHRDIPLIHISTDYVFDGTGARPYREDDEASPLGVYGESKWQGEQAIRSRLARHLIVRTAWLYGLHGKNFVKTILGLAGENESIRVVADQHGCPTWTEDLAGALAVMARRAVDNPGDLPWGTYHYCGAGQTSWHGFAEAIVEEGRGYQALKATGVVPISTAEYPTPARRPAYSVLDCGKIAASFGIQPVAWRRSLKSYLARTFEPGSA
jgi:dTDP-4-dehydrorhamnose reductase